MNHPCKFCNKDFTTKIILKTHQTTAKYCLKIQNKNPEETYECTYCSKKFNIKYNYDMHTASHLIDPVVIKLCKTEDEIKELKMKLDQKDEILKNALEQIKVFQEQNQKLLMKAVSTPKNTYNTVNIKNFTAMTQEHFKENAKNLTMDHINNGIKGYAEFMIDYPCKDSLVVTDASRKIFKYKDKDSKMCVDIEARNLINEISKAIEPKNRELIINAIEILKSNDKLSTLEHLNQMASLSSCCNGIAFLDAEFNKKIGRELVILTPKKVGELEDVSESDSEIVYYSDS
jgi:hypothetical protein